MHKLFVPRHTLKTDFSATAHVLKNFCDKKMLPYLVSLVIVCMWLFPVFKNYPRKRAELVSISKISSLSSP